MPAVSRSGTSCFSRSMNSASSAMASPRCGDATPDVNRRLTDRNDTDAMNHLRGETRILRGERFENAPDFALGHFGIGFVFERGNGLPVFLAAHNAAKFQPRTMRANRRRRRNFLRDRLVRELDFDFHAEIFSRPDTGGINATSSASANSASDAAYSQFFASRTLGRYAASFGNFASAIPPKAAPCPAAKPARVRPNRSRSRL